MPTTTEPTIHDLLAYLEATPDDSWCAYKRDDNQGHHCVLGHLDLDPRFAYRYNFFGIDNGVLASVNNHGNPAREWYVDEHKPHAPSHEIKARVLAFIRAKVTEPLQ